MIFLEMVADERTLFEDAILFIEQLLFSNPVMQLYDSVYILFFNVN